MRGLAATAIAGLAIIAAATLAAFAAPPPPAGASAGAMTVTTYPASPATIRLGAAPRCSALRYELGAPAREVEVEIINSAGHEVWDQGRWTSGVGAGVVYRFTWCGNSGGLVPPGLYRWRVDAEQAGTNIEGHSPWRTITVKR